MSFDPIPFCHREVPDTVGDGTAQSTREGTVRSVRRTVVRIATLATLVAVAACGTETGRPVPVSMTEPPDILHAAAQLPDAPASNSSTLVSAFADLQTTLDGNAGMAIMPVGGDQPLALGTWTTGVAWSTIKVPLALAALRRDPVAVADNAEAAIVISDNAAAEALWEALGSPSEAADAVEAILREAGDLDTDIAERHSRMATLGSDSALSFGATTWSLVNQVRFASRLPCLPYAGRVISLMSEITPSQSWGLGQLIGAEFKGGWGPDDETGAYTVRQFGLVPTLSGAVAVAMVAEPASGTFDDATAILDRMALLLSQHMPDLRGGSCAP